MSGVLQRCEEHAPRLNDRDGRAVLPVWSVGPSLGVLRRIIISWKGGGRLDLTRYITGRIAQSVASWATTDDGAESLSGLTSNAIIPIASTRSANRRRGGQLTTELAHAVRRALEGAGAPAYVADVLKSTAGSQKMLGVRTRGANALGGLDLKRSWRGGRFLLVDDVMTTGATIAAAMRILQAQGGVAIGAVVLAHHLDPSAIGQEAGNWDTQGFSHANAELFAHAR